MSHSNRAIKNKQQKHPKKFFDQYLYNANEPLDYIYINAPEELETELLEDRLVMKRHFRNRAQRLRNSYL